MVTVGEAVTGVEEDFQEAIGGEAAIIGETVTAVEKAGEIGVKSTEASRIDCIAYWRPWFGKVVRFRATSGHVKFSKAFVASLPTL